MTTFCHEHDCPHVIALTDSLAAARETLLHINEWATMDPAGELFPWIANETAAALARGGDEPNAG